MYLFNVLCVLLLASAMNTFTVMSKGMFSSPEALVEFFSEKKLKLKRSSKMLLTCVNLYSTGIVVICFKSYCASFSSTLICFHNKLTLFRAGM